MSLIEDSGEPGRDRGSTVRVFVLSIGMSKLILLLLLLLLLLLYPVRRNVTYHALFEDGNHTRVFEYLSDVSAFQELNPTIVNITHWERGNEEDFYVESTECLSQVPVVRNYGRAEYRIRHGEDGSHWLISTHSTCFYTSFLCLATDSSVHVRKLSDSEVGYREDIGFSCPWALTFFCFNEITFQRKLIVSRLKEVLPNRRLRS